MKPAPKDPLQEDDIRLRQRMAHLLEERFALFSVQRKEYKGKERKVTFTMT